MSTQEVTQAQRLEKLEPRQHLTQNTMMDREGIWTSGHELSCSMGAKKDARSVLEVEYCVGEMPGLGMPLILLTFSCAVLLLPAVQSKPGSSLWLRTPVSPAHYVLERVLWSCLS